VTAIWVRRSVAFVAPNNANKQQIKNCVSNFYNSKLGAAVQFGSPISLLPGWNPGWGNNLKEWGVAIVGKLGGLFGSGAVPGTTQITTLSGTQTVGSGVELATEGGLAAVEKVATPAMGAATLVDIMAHSVCSVDGFGSMELRLFEHDVLNGTQG
jgi:hypothetical protein